MDDVEILLVTSSAGFSVLRRRVTGGCSGVGGVTAFKLCFGEALGWLLAPSLLNL